MLDVVPDCAASQDSHRALCGAFGVYGISVRVLAVPVGTPLPDVSLHIVQAPFVGLQRPHGMRRVVGIDEVPANVIELGIAGVGAGRAGTAGVFAFCLGGKAVGPALLVAELSAE